MMNPFETRLGHGRPSGQGETVYTCPFCSKDGKFYLNLRKGRFICFAGNCAKSGGLDYLAKLLNVQYSPDDYHWHAPTGVLRQRVWGLDTGVPEQRKVSKVHIPELVPIKPFTQPWFYLLGRGLTVADIQSYECSLSPEDNFRKIYFPFRDDYGDVCFWVARQYLPGSRGPKYINPGDSLAKRLVWGVDQLHLSYPVSVCEGLISAIVAGNAVATLGVEFTEWQVAEICKLPAPEFLAAMDGEAFNASLKLANKIADRYRPVRVVPLPHGKDPADIGRLGYNELASRAFSVAGGSLDPLRARLDRLTL